jgi:AraC family transcriptional activator of pobA
MKKVDIHHPIDALGILGVSMSGIRIEKLEDRLLPAVPFPHKHDFFQIILITKGSGFHQIDFERYKVAKNQIFIMKPGQVHAWHMNQSVTGIVIEFTSVSLPEFVQELHDLDDHYIIKDQETFDDLLKLSLLMRKEFSGRKDRYDVALRGHLMALLIQFGRLKELHAKTRRHDTQIEKFRRLVEEHFRQEHRVEFYAKELRVGPRALTMQVTRALGKSPRLLIQERFLLEAKRYLAFSELTVAQIGYELGFDDANYFTRFFRQHVKMSPAKFRKVTSL